MSTSLPRLRERTCTIPILCANVVILLTLLVLNKVQLIYTNSQQSYRKNIVSAKKYYSFLTTLLFIRKIRTIYKGIAQARRRIRAHVVRLGLRQYVDGAQTTYCLSSIDVLLEANRRIVGKASVPRFVRFEKFVV